MALGAMSGFLAIPRCFHYLSDHVNYQTYYSNHIYHHRTG